MAPVIPEESAAMAVNAAGQQALQTAAASALPEADRLASSWAATLAIWEEQAPAVSFNRLWQRINSLLTLGRCSFLKLGALSSLP